MKMKKHVAVGATVQFLSAAALIALVAVAQRPKPFRCDKALWYHVYQPQRLRVLQKCVTVTGTIVDATHGRWADGVRHEPDGDTHGWLRLDPGQSKYLNAGNRQDEGGNLVFEVICHFPVYQADAKQACRLWRDNLVLPAVGSHVEITGSWVQDTNHGQWFELHPVTSIRVTK